MHSIRSRYADFVFKMPHKIFESLKILETSPRQRFIVRCCTTSTSRPLNHGSASSPEKYERDELVSVLGQSYTKDSMTNITKSLIQKIGRNLHLEKHHPLGIIKKKIETHMHGHHRSRYGGCIFAAVDNLSPAVTIEQNFDSLLVPKGHVSRAKNDNYYINSDNMLRAHTSAHQRDMIQSGWDAFLVTGDVYRRDEIDRSHYPVFHQMEGVRLFGETELFADHDDQLKIFEESGRRTNEKQEVHSLEAAKLVEFNLKYTLVKLVEDLFGEDAETRWVDAYFPFTHPSWELEVKYEGEWMEMLGCGIMEHGILSKGGASNKIGWAFGLGLERLAMKLFDIPDIRLFWSDDERFLNQFKEDCNVKFKPFSKYPPTYKDISFWITSKFTANDLNEVIRSIAGDIVEELKLVDEFTNPKTDRTSHCYRITYRAMDRTFTDDEINAVQDKIRHEVAKQLEVELR